ncbi:MAG TPA: hypothetical protein VFD77_00135 [Brumimicrobium sp.]|nr:hypothetical protein [Brumimicrobium sp.]
MRNIIIICFVFICSATYAQQYATSNTQCQLDINDILLEQSFDIDEPISEEARYIFFEMYEGLNLIYQSDSNDQKLAGYLNSFKETLQKASDLNLNVSMFQEDIDNISKMTQ